MRVLWSALLIGLLLTACGGGRDGAGNADVGRAKVEVDDLVTQTAPAFAEALGGEVRNATGRFLACQSGADFRYAATFEVTDPYEAADHAVALGDVLSRAGLTELRTSADRVVAERGRIRVTISERYPAGFRSVKVQSDCLDAGDEGSKLDDEPPETYSDLN